MPEYERFGSRPSAYTKSSRSCLIVSPPVIDKANFCTAAISLENWLNALSFTVVVCDRIGLPFLSNPVGEPLVVVAGDKGFPFLSKYPGNACLIVFASRPFPVPDFCISLRKAINSLLILASSTALSLSGRTCAVTA